MSTVPRKLPDAISWVATRVPVWTESFAAIGLDSSQVTDLDGLLSSAQTAKSEYDSAKAVSDAKYEAYQAAATAMRSTASAQVVQIRGFARSSANPTTVYSAAQIPEPATPSPAPAPGTPEGFRVQLLDTGGLRFTFKCDHPRGVSGVTYLVERQAGPQEPFTFLLNAKKREFADTSFPPTATTIAYRVTAQTSTKDGLASSFTVRYGANNQATILSEGGEPERLAS